MNDCFKEAAVFSVTSYSPDLFIWQETNVEVFVHLDIVDATADGRNHDDLPLLSLKLLHGSHLIPWRETEFRDFQPSLII